MINRDNFLHSREYLRYTERVRQNAPNTVKRSRGHLRHLLEWADATPLSRAKSLDPFPAYLAELGLSPSSIRKGLTVARGFYKFMLTEHPLQYKLVTDTWIESLRPSRSMRQTSRLPARTYYTIEEVIHICTAPVDGLRLQRAQAGAALLFLSGMRADALASIPISCVDLARKEIRQLPEFGVRTKGHKAAITYLINIPKLYEVAARWDRLLSTFRLPPAAMWYATITRDNAELTPCLRSYEGRNNTVQKDIKLLCETLGVTYLSPHKLRHGHVVYAVERVKNMHQLKAVSLNVMHSSVVITDGIYNRLVGDHVRDVISEL